MINNFQAVNQATDSTVVYNFGPLPIEVVITGLVLRLQDLGLGGGLEAILIHLGISNRELNTLTDVQASELLLPSSGVSIVENLTGYDIIARIPLWHRVKSGKRYPSLALNTDDTADAVKGYIALELDIPGNTVSLE